MRVLVACAKYGATEEIAERIGEGLRAAGIETDVRAVANTGNLTEYDAFVDGGAVYMGHWLEDATAFVRGLRPLLIERPVWLFASGPLGNARTDREGADLGRRCRRSSRSSRRSSRVTWGCSSVHRFRVS